MYPSENAKIAVIGLGYVGLPLAVEFGKKRPTVSFDINETRIAQLREGKDLTREVEADEFAKARHLIYATEPDDIAIARFTSSRSRPRSTPANSRI